jgi:hypothetical protein
MMNNPNLNQFLFIKRLSALTGIAVAKAIRTKPNTEILIPQSFPFCLLPYALCLLLYIAQSLQSHLKYLAAVQADAS